MLGRYQVPPAPSPPPPSPSDILEDDDELYFEEDDNDKEENPQLVALNAEFRADEERKAVKEVKDEDNNNADLAFLDDLPDPEEKTAKQRALLASFESAEKADNIAHARTHAEEEQLCRALELSVQWVPTEDVGCRLFAEERQCLLEDAVEGQALFAGIRKRWRAVVAAEEEGR
jgi:hypothetical protein